MLNQCIIVGRIESHHEHEGTLVLTVISSPDAEDYQKFKVDVTIPKAMRDNIEKNILPFVHSKHPLVGVKGKINKANNSMIFIAEKFTFVSGQLPQEVSNDKVN